MSFIIGTAGHIDHGKTSLVKALTGQDTDRLKEEKARGISIDLGFAHFDLPDGSRAGVVDVPGHDRFIRNMLAGAHGLDLVLFTVAADEGVMPQTEEHLDIVHLLGVSSAIFVVTKTDLVSPDRVASVREDVAILTTGTSLEGSPVVPFSAVTNSGLDTLEREIVAALQRRPPAPAAGLFRLPVDRVFVLQGHGLVVTGTARAGTVRVGDWVRCLPGTGRFRVRGLQVHGQPRDAGSTGERVALNLGGAEKTDIVRGHVICSDGIDRVSTRFDARLDVPPTRREPIRNHQRVRVHVGTAERLGKLTLLGSPETEREPFHRYCQIRLDEPVQIMRGDRFVIRDSTAAHTIGGGVVIHPWAPHHRRKEPGLDGWLRTLDGDDIGAIACAVIESGRALGHPLVDIALTLNATESDIRERLAREPRVRLLIVDEETLCTTEARWRHLEDHVRRSLAGFHKTHPLLAGMEMEELRGTLPHTATPKVFRAGVDELVKAGVVARSGSLIRLPEHGVTLQGETEELAGRILGLLGEQPLSPPELSQIERTLAVNRTTLFDVVRVLERERSIVRVTNDLYLLASAIDQLRAGIVEHFVGAATITPAEFRDRFGTSRKYAIPLLEYCDREGLTIRQGDVRRPGRASRVPTGG